jgi:hypothetical protein
MKTVRLAATVLSIVLLLAGYLASEYAALYGNSADYASRVDSPPVRNLALVMLLAAIVLSLVREQEEVP